MARAKRHYIPGYVWHLTHRCHQREFLLKFGKDRRRWLHWLFEAKKRYGLCILSYVATSNHIHLLVFDRGEHEVISRSMQLVAGRTAQEYNQRKGRKGAFWEDRYHATAVETGEHLVQCLVYMDLNMVRAGVVKHPSEWVESGYGEIQQPRMRYTLIDHQCLRDLLHIPSMDLLQSFHRGWVEESLARGRSGRDSKWTESIAVGNKGFVTGIKNQLGLRAKGRKVIESADDCRLQETQFPYSGFFGAKKSRLSSQNLHYWEVYPVDTDG
jgi:REP element-mobilizing transposase RayT